MAEKPPEQTPQMTLERRFRPAETVCLSLFGFHQTDGTKISRIDQSAAPERDLPHNGDKVAGCRLHHGLSTEVVSYLDAQ